MRNGNILLSVLGTFYKQVGKSALVGGLNDIYSSAVMNRYNDTLKKKIVLGSSDIPDVSHFGHIPWDGYAPNGVITRIVSPSGDEVDLSGVNYISFPYISEGSFFRLKNGRVSKRCVDEMSEIESDVYPVIYTVNATKKMFSNGQMSYYEHTSASDDKYLTRKAIDIVTSMSMYGKDNFYTLDAIANILCGAVYSVGEGEVLSVSGTEIDTTVGIFYYDEVNNGVPIVTVGQKLTGISILTRQVIISTDGSLLPEVSKINERMKIYSSSPSRVDYLKKISSAISKRRYTILVPVSVFTSIGKDGVSILSSILNTALTSSFDTSTNIFDSDTISVEAEHDLMVKDNPIVKVSIIEVLKIDLIDNSTINISVKEETLFKDNDEASVDDEMAVSMMPLELNDSIEGIDSKLRLVELPSSIGFREDYKIDGEKTDHTITGITATDDIKISDTSIVKQHDTGGVFSDGKALLNDTISSIESDASTVEAYTVSDILLREKRSFILKKNDNARQDYSLQIQTTRKFFEGGAVASKMESKTDDTSLFTNQDSTGVSLFDTTTGVPLDENSSVGINKMDYSSITTEEIETLKVNIKEKTIGVDESVVTSANEIDER